MMFDDCIMARRDELGAERGGLVPKVAELDPFIAHDAGVRGAAGPVFVSEVIDDEALEGDCLVNHVVGDSQRMGDPTGVGDGLGAAALVLGPAHAVLGPEFHGDTDDFPSLFFQEPGGHA